MRVEFKACIDSEHKKDAITRAITLTGSVLGVSVDNVAGLNVIVDA